MANPISMPSDPTTPGKRDPDARTPPETRGILLLTPPASTERPRPSDFVEALIHTLQNVPVDSYAPQAPIKL
ncbi:hypothetical protein GQ53DRAFT_756644 [Thozetella sp. PMI_491]|nr:hypothetical protein GQ53DRAFT_756644 [Thozetella sp. PMI_491]